LPSRLAEILKSFGDDRNAQECRVAQGFAAVALAGELAIEWGILPWKIKAAHDATVEIFKHWRSTQPQSKQSREHAQILKGVRDFLETYSASFSDIDWSPNLDIRGRIINPEPVIHERAGYWKEVGNTRFYLFTTKGLEKASSGFGSRRAAQVLDEVGALKDKDAGKRTKKVRTPGGHPTNFYYVDPEKLTEEKE
jgi:putative DNA primase/helicase